MKYFELSMFKIFQHVDNIKLLMRHFTFCPKCLKSGVYFIAHFAYQFKLSFFKCSVQNGSSQWLLYWILGARQSCSLSEPGSQFHSVYQETKCIESSFGPIEALLSQQE
jgi:hypothetical protein